MKKIQAFIIIILFTNISCSTYSVKNVLEKSAIKNAKSSGIIIRVGAASFIPAKEYGIDLGNWVAGYKKMNKLEVINDADSKISIYTNENRFYQLDSAKKFLEYKSKGTIIQFINANREELKKLLTQKNLDSLIIYEVDSIFSSEMFFIDFTSMIVVFDKNLDLLYMDYQADYFDDLEVDGGDSEKIAKQTINTVNKRVINKMISFGYLKD